MTKQILFLFIQLLFIQGLSAQSSIKVTTQNLNLREAPHTRSKVLSVLPKGTTVTVNEECDCEWIPVDYEGQIGYIFTDYLTTPEEYENQTDESRFYVVTSSLNVRRSASTGSSILGTFSKGQVIYVNNISGNWAEVTITKDSRTQTGYIHTGYLKKATRQQAENFKSKQNQTDQTGSGSVQYYTNSYGERVQSPTYYHSAPAGATALCRDGTYSFSRNRRGTCSHHGGVARWL